MITNMEEFLINARRVTERYLEANAIMTDSKIG